MPALKWSLISTQDGRDCICQAGRGETMMLSVVRNPDKDRATELYATFVETLCERMPLSAVAGVGDEGQRGRTTAVGAMKRAGRARRWRSRHGRLGVSGDIVPRLILVSDQPVQGVMSFLRDARIKGGRGRLSLEAGICHGPVVSVNQIGLVENGGDRPKGGVFDELRRRPFGHRPCAEFHVADSIRLAQLIHEAQGPEQSPGGFMPPRELDSVVLRGRTVLHEGKFFRGQMRSEFVEFQNIVGYLRVQPFALGGDQEQTESAQSDFVLRALRRLGRGLDNGQSRKRRHALAAKDAF